MPTTPRDPYISAEIPMDLGNVRRHVWTDAGGVTHATSDHGAARMTFHSRGQIEYMIARLALLADEYDAEVARQEEGDGEDPDDDGDTLNDQTAAYWPALGLGRRTINDLDLPAGTWAES